MKVLIVMFLVTVIAHGVTPKLKCWDCEDEIGQPFCSDPNFIELEECKEDEKFCVDLVHKKFKSMKKRCINEEDYNDIKSRYGGDVIMKTCDTTGCNTGKWEDYMN